MIGWTTTSYLASQERRTTPPSRSCPRGGQKTGAQHQRARRVAHLVRHRIGWTLVTAGLKLAVDS